MIVADGIGIVIDVVFCR